METGVGVPHRIPRGSSPAVNFRRFIDIVAQAARGGHHHACRRSRSRPAEADNPSLVAFAAALFRYADESTFVAFLTSYEVCHAAGGDRFPTMLREVPR